MTAPLTLARNGATARITLNRHEVRNAFNKGLVACADIVVAVDAAGFCLSEAKLGLVHEVVAADALDAKVDELVAAITANGRDGVQSFLGKSKPSWLPG